MFESIRAMPVRPDIVVLAFIFKVKELPAYQGEAYKIFIYTCTINTALRLLFS